MLCSPIFVICVLAVVNDTWDEGVNNYYFCVDIRGPIWREDQVQETMKWFSECTSLYIVMIGQNIHFLSVPSYHKVLKHKADKQLWNKVKAFPFHVDAFSLWQLSCFSASNNPYPRQQFSEFSPQTVSTGIIWKLDRNVHSQSSSQTSHQSPVL